MARIAGIQLPGPKRMEIALTYIFGIGRPTAQKILKEASVDPALRAKDLSADEEQRLRAIIEKHHRVEGDLKREIVMNIKRLKEITSYRGTRHARGLPARGQRTRTNSRTVRGNVRRTMGSGRKTAAEKT